MDEIQPELLNGEDALLLLNCAWSYEEDKREAGSDDEENWGWRGGKYFEKVGIPFSRVTSLCDSGYLTARMEKQQVVYRASEKGFSYLDRIRPFHRPNDDEELNRIKAELAESQRLLGIARLFSDRYQSNFVVSEDRRWKLEVENWRLGELRKFIDDEYEAIDRRLTEASDRHHMMSNSILAEMGVIVEDSKLSVIKRLLNFQYELQHRDMPRDNEDE